MEESHKEHWDHSHEHHEHHQHAHERSSEHNVAKERPATSKPKKEGGDGFWKVTTVVLIVVLAFLVFRNPAASTGTTGGTVAAPSPSPSAPSAGQIDMNSLMNDAPTLGSNDAPVTVVEFSDFSCPYCAMASGDNEQYLAYAKQNFGASWEPIVTNLIKDYVDTGKVKFVSKYMMGHSGGHPAQLVGWCLEDQSSDLFWKFYPAAFADQQDVEDLAKMKDLAKGLGADMTELQSCLDSNKYQSRFDTEQSEGIAVGVRGTPAFIVGKSDGQGTLISGAVPYSQVKQAVEAALQ